MAIKGCLFQSAGCWPDRLVLSPVKRPIVGESGRSSLQTRAFRNVRLWRVPLTRSAPPRADRLQPSRGGAMSANGRERTFRLLADGEHLFEHGRHIPIAIGSHWKFNPISNDAR